MGEKGQSAYNGISGRSAIIRCFCQIVRDHFLVAKLRPGQVYSAEEWEDLLLPRMSDTSTTVTRWLSVRILSLTSPRFATPWKHMA